jgi:hypothetical protein
MQSAPLARERDSAEVAEPQLFDWLSNSAGLTFRRRPQKVRGMAPEEIREITVVYTRRDLTAYIHRSRNDALRVQAEGEGGEVAAEGDPVELREEHVKGPDEFTKFFEDNAHATTTLRLWCLRDVWLKLVTLLEVYPPYPPIVYWPLQKDKRGE